VSRNPLSRLLRIRNDRAGSPSEAAPQQQELSLRVLLQEMIQRGASDLHITVGNPAKLRIDGDLANSRIQQVLAPKDTLSLAYSILTDNQKKRFETEDELDFSFGVQNLSRFRGNVYKQRGCVAMAIRQIPYEIVSIEKLGLPPIVNQLGE
jgi:twitching motility protein PilT